MVGNLFCKCSKYPRNLIKLKKTHRFSENTDFTFLVELMGSSLKYILIRDIKIRPMANVGKLIKPDKSPVIK